MTLNFAIEVLKALVQIGFIYLLTYKFLLLVRGTRGVQVVQGVVVLLVAWAVAERLQLTALSDMVRYAVAVGPLALVVLFQPELRRGLAALGKTPMFGFGGGGERTVGEVVRSAAHLSRRKIGAIIVVEREVPLDSVLESGVPVDARLTAELLNTIFTPLAPLHDGAVIVRKDRVAGAACILPIAEASGEVRTLGTRHRAAVGVTEDSDAVAVVVSEETGVISLAVAGRLERNLSPSDLRRRLSALLMGERRRRFAPPRWRRS